MKTELRAYMLEQLKKLLAIDSTTGDCREIEAYLCEEIARLGYTPRRLHKGGVTADLGGEGNGLFVTAHVDDIGLMVRRIRPDGSLWVARIGGLHPFMCEQANARIHTRDGRVYTGVLRRANPSLHLMPPGEREATGDFDKNVFLYLDEEVKSAEDTAALGIRCGDFVALAPETVFCPSGYIKSRYLDDKVSAAVLLTVMRALREEQVSLRRHVTAYFSCYEEIGHGGGTGLPEDTMDVLAVDIGCCGPNNDTDEKKVTICVKDAAFPYHVDMVNELLAAAEASGAAHVLDMFLPSYSTDANVAIRTGRDVRHGLIGPGVLSTHGYERTHIESLEATYALLREYVAR